MPAISTSIRPDISTWRVRLRRRSRATPAGGAVSTTTAGTKFGAAFSVGPAADCRACRRHVNTCCGVSPRRRATSETTAPTTSVSSTIWALKSSENRRRRPVPVITSNRRNSVASGLSVWSSVDTSRSPTQRSSQSPITSPNRRWDHHSAYPTCAMSSGVSPTTQSIASPSSYRGTGSPLSSLLKQPNGPSPSAYERTLVARFRGRSVHRWPTHAHPGRG